MRWTPERAVFVLAAVLAAPGTALANTITIDPGNYIGRYFVQSVGELSGPAQIDLPDGTYSVDNGSSVLGSSFNFTFSVNNGGVTSDNPIAAVGSGSTLTFNNATVTIDPGTYGGRYFIQSHFPQAFTQAETLVLIPGLVYVIDDGSEILGSTFSFSIGADGTVTSLDSNAATANGATLTFRSTTVTVDPASYTGNYILSSYYPKTFSGLQQFQLIPDLAYSLDDGSSVVGSAFTFNVNADGTVSVPAGAPATASGAALTFATVPVTIDPGFYSGTYSLSSYGLKTLYTGVQTFSLVPGTYTFLVGSQVVAFSVDASDQVTALASADVASGGHGILSFGPALGGGVRFPGTLNVALGEPTAAVAVASFSGNGQLSGVDAAGAQDAVLGIAFDEAPAGFVATTCGERSKKWVAGTAAPNPGVGVAPMRFDSLFTSLSSIQAPSTAGTRGHGDDVARGSGSVLVTSSLRLEGEETLGDATHRVIVVVRPSGPDLPRDGVVRLEGRARVYGTVFVDLCHCTASPLSIGHDLVRVGGEASVHGLIVVDGPAQSVELAKHSHLWSFSGHGALAGAAVARFHAPVAGHELPVVSDSGEAKVQYDSSEVKAALAAVTAAAH